jgi:hypothetical protein
MQELPHRLERRFQFYLNFLPVVEKVGLYGTLSLGLFISIFAVTRVAFRASKSFASQQYNHNLANNSVYNPCERRMSKQDEAANGNDNSEDDADDRQCLNVIRRDDEYELENDDALSDIEYNNEINEDEEDTTSASERVSKFAFLVLLI